MNEHPETRWQPPSQSDLRRFPPKNATCRAFREMMRDYADGDLPAGPRRSLENHVHVNECRDCALALSRVEHETLRLRRALTAAPVGAPADLKRRVLERVLAGDLGEREKPSAPTAAPPRSVPLPLAVALAIAAMVVGALLVLEGSAPVERAPRLHVESARAAWWEQDAVARRLEADEQITPPGRLRVEWDGQARLRMGHPDRVGALTDGTSAGALLELAGGARLDVEGPAPMLLSGAMTVHSQWLQPVSMPDGTVVEFGRGSYHLDVTDFLAFDSPLHSEYGAIRVRLEVLDGHPARLARLGGDVVEVRPGSVARYAGWSPLRVEETLQPQHLLAALAGATPAEKDTPVEPVGLSGLVVVADTQATVPGAHVRVRRLWEETVHEVDTDDEGRYVVPIEGSLSAGEHVLVSVAPPAGEPDLALRPLRPTRLVDAGSGVQIAPVELHAVAPLHGSVRDPSHRRLEGVRILPCLVDELSDTMLPLDGLQTTSQVGGRFVLRGLPVDLAPYQGLSLLVAHDKAGVTVHPLPEIGLALATDLQLDVVLGAVESVVEELPADRTVTIAERLGSNRGMVVVRRHELETDLAGRARLLGSGGACFLEKEDGSWVELVRRHDAVDSTWHPGNPEATRLPRPGKPVEALDMVDIEASVGHRYGARFGFDGAGTEASHAVVVVAKDTRLPVAGAELFALDRGPMQLRGITGAAGSVPAEPGLFVAIGPDGSLGTVVIQSDRSEPRVELELTPGGTVELAPELRPGPEAGPAPLRLACEPDSGGVLASWPGMGGLDQTFVRYVGGAGVRPWTTGLLPHGKWRVLLPDGTEREHTIVPGALTTLK